jgi:predicted enzyme related to lactoylglutathione lyase
MEPSRRFARLTLRTTDVVAARDFYAELLGHAESEVVALHEQAIARGAQPHWLGQIEVDDVERVATAFEAHGAARLGPTNRRPDGRELAVVRDPGGAVVGLVSPGRDAPTTVRWHLLHTTAFARVCEAYTTLFDWRLTDEQVTEHGTFQSFAWSGTSDDAGAITDITGLPGRHPHWLFQFPVADLDRAVRFVRERGGVVIGPFGLPRGERVAVCDDPQGAAFALRE